MIINLIITIRQELKMLHVNFLSYVRNVMLAGIEFQMNTRAKHKGYIGLVIPVNTRRLSELQ